MSWQIPFAAHATVPAERVAELRNRLERMGCPGSDDSGFPFDRMRGVHFARVVLLEESARPGRRPTPASLMLISEIDAPLRAHLDDLADLAGNAVDATFGLCDGYPETPTPAARRSYLRARRVRPRAAYVNAVGSTVARIRAEAALREEIETFLDEHRDRLPTDPVAARAAVADFVRTRPDLRWALRPARGPGLRRRAVEAAHLAAALAVLVALAPPALVLLPAYLVALRLQERMDPAPHLRPTAEHVARLARLEDRAAQNAFSAVGYVKPGLLRRVTITVVLWSISVATRHVLVHGSLGGVRTIHFARWTALDGLDRVVFTSAYDGGLEGYNDDFIDNVAYGLNAAFSNGTGYPPTRFLLFGGARREQEFKDWLRRRQVPTQVFYSAYDRLSTSNIENNARIRSGLSGTLAPNEAAAWLRRL